MIIRTKTGFSSSASVVSFLILFVISISARAQYSAFSSFRKLSCPEKWWVIGHPFVAKKAFKITIEARKMSDSLKVNNFMDGDANGGQIDAFRHSYWMARLAQNMNWHKALSLGKAHEKANWLSFKKSKSDEDGVLPDSVSVEMDLFNNKVGVTIGCENKLLDKNSIYKKTIDAIYDGKMKIISKDINKNELDCSGSVIDKRTYFEKWGIPKCLINSNAEQRK